MKKLFAGNVPYIVVLGLVVGAFLLGQRSVPPTGKFAIAEKGTMIMEAVLDRQDASDEVLKKEVLRPILGVLQSWADKGYVVIDATRDEHGNLMVAALPDGVIDITDEMRAAIPKRARVGTQPQPPTPNIRGQELGGR